MLYEPNVVILGAGPAGLGAAYKLATADFACVTVLEKNNHVGGNAGSFKLAGMHVDYGSHRLHPACDPVVLADIRNLLDGDLLDRPRHGRIRLRDRWIHFPLQPFDLATRLPLSFGLGVLNDSIRKMLSRGSFSANGKGENFASVLKAGLGETICNDFYFPYARKLWGVEPEELSAIQARRRVSAGSVGKIMRKVASALPGFKPSGYGRFFYPKHGYGEISDAYFRAAQRSGATIILNAEVKLVEIESEGGRKVHYDQGGQSFTINADHIWSTMPITVLARKLKPKPPFEYLKAAEAIDYRAMILIYLVLEQDQFSEFDAHYFPETDIPISRLSEPKNYSASHEPIGRTVLCAELPCSPMDPVWQQSDDELSILVSQSLETAGLIMKAPISSVATRRLRQAYPIYLQGYEKHFDTLDRWLSQVDSLLTFGRQGLFAHDNTHHALYMAYSAVECFDEDGQFDQNRWHEFREIFKTHVVED
jgi:protoporphyrinogen oxidase